MTAVLPTFLVGGLVISPNGARTGLMYKLNHFNHLNAELNPIRHLIALVEARHIVHVSRVKVNLV